MLLRRRLEDGVSGVLRRLGEADLGEGLAVVVGSEVVEEVEVERPSLFFAISDLHSQLSECLVQCFTCIYIPLRKQVRRFLGNHIFHGFIRRRYSDRETPNRCWPKHLKYDPCNAPVANLF